MSARKSLPLTGLEFEQMVEDLHQEQMNERSPAEWWEEDHLEAAVESEAAELTVALETLVMAGCGRGEILERLRHIEWCRGKNATVPLRELRAFARRLDHLADQIEKLSGPECYYVPDAAELVGGLRKIVKCWKSLRSEKALRSSAINSLTSYVEARTKKGLGKRLADRALRPLISRVSDHDVTESAVRARRTRAAPKGKKVVKEKRRRGRPRKSDSPFWRNRKPVSIEQGDRERARMYRP